MPETLPLLSDIMMMQIVDDSPGHLQPSAQIPRETNHRLSHPDRLLKSWFWLA